MIVLWWIFSGFFLWLAAREIFYGFVPRSGFDNPNSKISMPYVLTTAAIAAALAYTPVRYWHFERFLTEKARILSETDTATVHCNSFLDSVVDSNVFAVGHANLKTGRIVFQHPWCGHLMDYLDQPDKATPEGISSLLTLTHEAMHIRGELNEARTECQAIQRYYRAATLLGVADRLAKAHGLAHYNGPYKSRSTQGDFSRNYYSDECAPGKALDEQLSDSTWD
jgi:hypothetical protein